MNILMVGLGSIGGKHVKTIRALVPDVQIYALRSSKSSEVKLENVQSIYDLLEIDLVDIDFIMVTNPTAYHVDTIRSTLTLKKPIFIEKPLAHSLDGIPEVIAMVDRAGIKTYVACNMRFHPALCFLKENIGRLGAIDEVNVYCGSDLQTWRKDRDFRSTYSTKSELGGGVHLDLIHELDYIYWLFGKPLSVVRHLTSKSVLGISAIDYANYTLSYSGLNVSVILNYYRIKPKREIEIVSRSGIWNVDLLSGKVVDENDEVVFEVDHFLMTDTYRAQLIYFLENVVKGEKGFNSIKEAFEVLKICLDE